MNPNERYIHSLEGQLDKLNKRIDELEKHRGEEIAKFMEWACKNAFEYRNYRWHKHKHPGASTKELYLEYQNADKN